MLAICGRLEVSPIYVLGEKICMKLFYVYLMQYSMYKMNTQD